MFGKRTVLTFALGRLIIGFADELSVFHEVEFISSVELSCTHDAGEALKVVDVILSSSHNLRGWYTQFTTSALGSESSAPTAPHIHNRKLLHLHYCLCIDLLRKLPPKMGIIN